ncbi:MAG TPA: MFS transporter [Methylomirabilota bacterium]|nr:MFS transporter [Methylomirabilota bacterium]
MAADQPGRFPAGMRAFQHRDFRLFWLGQLVSLVGTWMQSVAQSWLVLELTGSPLRLGLVGALQFSPMLFFSFLAGALADRLPKRRLIVASQVALLAQSLLLGLLVWSGHVRYWHVAALAALYGLASTLDMPARQSFLVEMVGKEDLLNAIALNSAMFNGARMVGPAVAGLVIARWGLAPAFLLNAASFLAVLVALGLLRAEGRPRAPSGSTLRAEIGEGVRYALGSVHIRLVLSLVLAVSVFLFNYNVLVPLVARDVLGESAQGFGLLMAAVGVGAVLGAIALAAAGRERPSLTTLAAFALVLAATTVALAGVRRFWLAALCLLVMGGCGILFMAGANTTLQLTVPDELRGRIMSLHALVFAGVTPIGSLLVGAVTEAAGVPAGLVVMGGAGLLAVLALLAWSRRREPD